MLASDFWILIIIVVLAFWWFGLDGMLCLGRRGRHGPEKRVVDEVIEKEQAKRPPSEAQLLLNKLDEGMEGLG